MKLKIEATPATSTVITSEHVPNVGEDPILNLMRRLCKRERRSRRHRFVMRRSKS